ncbi:MAG: hypothetical protein F6J94_22350 [Moorea sp. SIO1F2]|nr:MULTISPECIES: hypothetical protein [unclassified Moorena]NEO61272.1 hypothetical protein [Moorena sp. SIO4G2]NEQ61554.1 hypothetical protein [Moorena sp. SIO4A1]NEQ81062.1 hypothetical protein [Moorena sp. SIO2I5]NEO05646.1 hypothetical protein [Moorena sp. SIO3I8]NEO23630.1 hypothetical protein [Moorena sp. SIO4A5]
MGRWGDLTRVGFEYVLSLARNSSIYVLKYVSKYTIISGVILPISRF